ncbi:putative MFS family arabinose efflux permease [Catenulispora sp. MAP12-49]|uniref:MFS transporter n=1 Tax=Catenulispora sp. MAP12-49 TaxID=3156302 RepID=UPI0035194DBA
MRTYRQLFASPEFPPLFFTSLAQVAAQTVSGLALATLIYAATGSPLLSALSMFGPSLAQVIGATALMSAADRIPPRAAMAGLGLVFAVETAVLAIPGLPVAAAFGILFVTGVLASVGGGVRYGLLNEILPKEGYLIGRSVLNMAVGTMQICGYGLGGVLLTALSPRVTLLVGAGLYLAAAVVARFGLSARPPRASGRPSVAQTWRNNAVLWSSVPRRYVFLALWVPNGLIVGCESLFVSLSPRHAGVLFAFAAFGMLLGDITTGRFLPASWRRVLGAPLRLLLAVPYLVFAFHPALPIAAAAVMLASVGYAASLLLQERLMALTLHALSGQALGLQSSGMLTMQGVGAVLAGVVAQWSSPSDAMTVMAVASVVVTLSLARGLRPERVESPVEAATALAPVS